MAIDKYKHVATGRRRDLTRMMCAATVAVTGVAACSSGAAKSLAARTELTSPQLTSGVNSTTSTTSTTLPPVTTVAKSVWFAGYKVTVNTATLIPAAVGDVAELTLDATFANQGETAGSFAADMSVTSQGQDYPSTSNDIPKVPGSGEAKGTLTFKLGKKATLDDAVLTFGKPKETRAIIPLGSTGKLVALEPVKVTGLSPSLSSGDVQLDLSSGEVRADRPTDQQQAEKGHWYLYISGKAQVTNAASYGENFGPDQLSLKLPDGTSAAAEAADSKSCCFALYPNKPPGEFTFRFVVNDPPAGAYTGTFKAHNATASPFTLTVPAATSGASASSTGTSTSTTKP